MGSFPRIVRTQEWNRGRRSRVVRVTRSTVYSCLLNCMPGIGCGLYSCEMCAPIWIEALDPIQKNGFVFGWKKCETSRAGLNDCEFPVSGGWHTLALRNGSTLNTSIYRRTRNEGWLRR